VEDSAALSTSELVAYYREAARAHARATLDGNSLAAYENAAVIAAVHRELRQRHRQSALLALLDDPERGVRGWAGAHALEFAPEQAEAALSALAESSDLIAFDAEMTLQEWRAGRLRFP
jgi:hypothetical protein